MSQQKKALDINEALATSEAFFIKYRKWVIGGSIAVLVLIAAWVGGMFYFEKQNELGQYEITLGERYVQTGDWEKAVKGDGATFKGYEKIARNYPCTDAANIAHLWVISTWAITKRPSLNSKSSLRRVILRCLPMLWLHSASLMWPTNSSIKG